MPIKTKELEPNLFLINMTSKVVIDIPPIILKKSGFKSRIYAIDAKKATPELIPSVYSDARGVLVKDCNINDIIDIPEPTRNTNITRVSLSLYINKLDAGYKIYIKNSIRLIKKSNSKLNLLKIGVLSLLLFVHVVCFQLRQKLLNEGHP